MQRENLYPTIKYSENIIMSTTVGNLELPKTATLLSIKLSKDDDKELLLVFDEGETDSLKGKLGVIVKARKARSLNDNTVRIVYRAEKRVEIHEVVEDGTVLFSAAVEKPYFNVDSSMTEALYIQCKRVFSELLALEGDKNVSYKEEDFPDNPIVFLDYATSWISQSVASESFYIDDAEERMRLLLEKLVKRLEVSKLVAEIDDKCFERMSENQKDYFLREKIRIIKEELGETEEEEDIYEKKILALNAPEETKDKLLREVKRAKRMAGSSAESAGIINYLDWVTDLPWGVYTEDNNDLKNAEKILKEDHYGMEKVKKRLIEFLAVRALSHNENGSIICLVGPPGVGKTSVARSIARALNRKYVRMSLGGVRDEADIRGHRRTYIGSMPGRIINGIKQAKSSNPLFLLDEVDKLGKDYKGDPSNALLEVLDPEQNCNFRDHYLEVPYDLSKVLFIVTANDKYSIPEALFDRLEVIDMEGYTPEEKLKIAKKYLVKKLLKENGIEDCKVNLSDKVILEIIVHYTMEAGVRELERQISKIFRALAVEVLKDNTKKEFTIKIDNLAKYLGVEKYHDNKKAKEDRIGIATGLAWTAYGGDLLNLEVSLMEGKGEIILTGQLGDVMQESARIAISFIKSNAKALNVSAQIFKENDIHIHAPEGATPKDGPSAGITMVTAIYSAITKKKIRRDLAMTGEVTLKGEVLGIGGLKEKSLAAERAGIFHIIVPEENRKNIPDLSKSVVDKMQISFVKNVFEVLKIAIIDFEEKHDN